MAMTFRSFQMSPISSRERLGQRDTPAVAISQVLFRGALLRERQRADRYNDPLLLLEVASGDGVSANQSPSHWNVTLPRFDVHHFPMPS